MPVCTKFEVGFGFQFLVLFSISRGEKTSRSNTFCESYKVTNYIVMLWYRKSVYNTNSVFIRYLLLLGVKKQKKHIACKM